MEEIILNSTDIINTTINFKSETASASEETIISVEKISRFLVCHRIDRITE